MLEYTRLMLKKTMGDIRTFTYILGLVTQIFSLAYLLFAIITDSGNLIANIILLCVSAVYFGIHIGLYDAKEKRMRQIKSVGRHASAAIKLAIKAVTLGISVYGIYIAAKDASIFIMFFSAGMVIFWLLQVLVELLSYYIETRYELFMAAIEADLEFVTKPIGAAKNIIKRVTGQQIEPEKEPNKYRRKLDKEVGEMRDERRREQEEKKRLYNEQKARMRAERWESSIFGRLKKRRTDEKIPALPEPSKAEDPQVQEDAPVT